MKQIAIATCPNCKSSHTIGEYNSYKEIINNKVVIISAPPDIICPCDQVLRPAVSIFKVTEFGYILRIKNPNERLRTKDNVWKLRGV